MIPLVFSDRFELGVKINSTSVFPHGKPLICGSEKGRRNKKKQISKRKRKSRNAEVVKEKIEAKSIVWKNRKVHAIRRSPLSSFYCFFSFSKIQKKSRGPFVVEKNFSGPLQKHL
ncbi:hypothetical protein CDAR_588221 [Caerostris darwini]|uniref:Uncharacterized protein n=1 Tax=Caerostris darwini TaxID=1538125 RepID=A0AAV4S3V8_9ARAC|nr:hypothetical protein CDAR_588221 [Caerostris darwini]